ncbi:hypothetical protein CN495_08950 [Bacillus thuringiensis]|uniref:Uncharacterized protein n=1 Tax=Bacillus thuringiensis TaxID=1428 RepID=A0ABD6S7Q4_BACTU|nr:hypothetical protein [Bacillus thuringiensis]PER55869.1 hypothetical protein CN495_08950 [Bacillus thuringiensis]
MELYKQLHTLHQGKWQVLKATGCGIVDYVVIKPSKEAVSIGLVYGKTDRGNPILEGNVWDIKSQALHLHKTYAHMAFEEVTVRALLSFLLHVVWEVQCASPLDKVCGYIGKTKEDLWKWVKEHQNCDIHALQVEGKSIVWQE